MANMKRDKLVKKEILDKTVFVLKEPDLERFFSHILEDLKGLTTPSAELHLSRIQSKVGHILQIMTQEAQLWKRSPTIKGTERQALKSLQNISENFAKRVAKAQKTDWKITWGEQSVPDLSAQYLQEVTPALNQLIPLLPKDNPVRVQFEKILI